MQHFTETRETKLLEAIRERGVFNGNRSPERNFVVLTKLCGFASQLFNVPLWCFLSLVMFDALILYCY